MSQQTTTTPSIETDHVVEAAKYAVGAFVVGLAATIALLAVTVDGFDFDLFGIGITFYGAHNVQLSSGFLSANGLKLVTSEHGLLKVLWAVPPATLAFAGYSFADTDLGRAFGPEQRDGAKAGALVAGGYGVLALLGTFVVTRSGASPNLGEAIVYMGILYPVVFGGLGGYLSR